MKVSELKEKIERMPDNIEIQLLVPYKDTTFMLDLEQVEIGDPFKYKQYCLLFADDVLKEE